MEEQVIELPQPIHSPSRRVSDIIDLVLSKRQLYILTWIGKDEICELIYLYLFKKYGHNCMFSLNVIGRTVPLKFLKY